MKRNTLIFLYLLLGFTLGAQSIQDSCNTAQDLGVLPYCDSQVFTNMGASFEDSLNIAGDCSQDSLVDIWFTFTPADTATNYRFSFLPDDQGNSPIGNGVISIYSGSCENNSLTPLYCFYQDSTNNVVTEIRNLNPGETYYIRVGSPDSLLGDFSLCIEARRSDYSINEGFSTACLGTIYDDGGVEGNYEDNRRDIFTICPEDEHACLSLILESHELEYKLNGGGDYINFYDGPDTLSPLLLSTKEINDADGTPEGIYGGTGLQVKAGSGCLTILFVSDNSVNYEGFFGEWFCSPDSCVNIDSVTYDIKPTEDQLGTQLSTPYTDVKVSKLNCPDSSYAIFTLLQGSEFPISKGVLLTNGRALDGFGANDSIVRSTAWGSPGVGLLDSLSMQYGSALTTSDGCELEVTVFAQTDELFMDYILASEEYSERILGDENDLAGVFISGANIVPDPMLEPFNLLSNLPDPQNTPVQIQTVNQQNKYAYYHPNPNSQEMAYDGFVTDSLDFMKPLTATAMVKPCNTYTFRMSVADRGSDTTDTGLFFSDIRAALPSITGPARIIENCPEGNTLVTVRANKPAMDTIKFYIELSGSAERNEDYIFDAPNPIIIPPGEQEASFPIEVIIDGVRENVEQIIMNLSVDYGCGRVEVGSHEIMLWDEPFVDIISTNDTIVACFGEAFVNADGNTQSYRWSPEGIFDDFRSKNVRLEIDQSQWIYVRAFTPGIPCERFDSVFVKVVSPSGVATVDRNQICLGESITLTATDIQGSDFNWRPGNEVSNPNQLVTSATPKTSSTFELVVLEEGCEFTQEIFVQVDSLPDLSILTDPFTAPYCRGDIVPLSTPLFIRTDYPGLQTNWENYDPDIFVNDPGPGALNPEILIDQNITLTRTAINGACRDTQSLTLEVIDPILELNTYDTLLCPGEEVVIFSSISNGTFIDINYSWDTQSQDIIIEGTGSQITVSKTGIGPGVVNLTAEIDGCTRSASVVINVPNVLIELMAMPDVEVGEGAEVTIDGTVRPDTLHSIVSYEWCRDGVELGVNALQLIDKVLRDSQVYTLKVMDDLGCVYSKDITIIGIQPEYKVPNVFTPNGDENNDEFGVVFTSGKYDIKSMKIFNRWGQMVFSGTGDERWDGTHNGKPAVLEVYAYIIEMLRPSGEVIYLTGDVTLLR